jgi:plasmid stabilization system protein ParE
VTRQVEVKARARFDVRIKAAWFLANVSVAAAARWTAGILAAISALAHDADRWPEAHEAAKLGRDLRCKLFRRSRHVYRILFNIDGDVVNVHRVRHAAQDDLDEDDV